VAEIITFDDLPTATQSAELIHDMVAGANAKASRVAPCLADTPTADQLSEAKLVLLGAIKRWAEAGSGALQSQTAGIYGMTVDTRQRTGYNLWPSEISDLQAICSTGPTGREAFSIDTYTPTSSAHLPWCSISLGEPCSCGSSLNRYEGPLYEFGYGPDPN
jgi:hypothetical protein